jgi:Protein of unknown function (DUF2510)
VTQPNLPPPSEPTPGFYPDSHGVMRLWDGQRWTDVTRPMPQPATAPAGQPGYYPDSQGVMRWWTGRDWAPHTQPPAIAQLGPPNELPKNWFQRNIGWKLAVLRGIAVLGSCGVIIGGTDDRDTTTTSTLRPPRRPAMRRSLHPSRPRKPQGWREGPRRQLPIHRYEGDVRREAGRRQLSR